MNKVKYGEDKSILPKDADAVNRIKCVSVTRCFLPQSARFYYWIITIFGATLKETARTLRKETRLSHPIVPFNSSDGEWKLGKDGMI